MPIINENFAEKAESYKIELKHKKRLPQSVTEFKEDKNSFQNLKAEPISEVVFPITLNPGESVLLDFGDHCVGYLNYSLKHKVDKRITDSPVKFKFTFGEFPLEIVTPEEDYCGTLGAGWIQREEKQTVFTPYSAVLERRYSFRYLLIERTDTAPFPIDITDIFADCVSAVDLENTEKISIPDKRLKDIYDISLKTLKECEQEVFEDGPKRDRRLWIGDLRLEALTDYKTFKNYPLIKKCIYLFAAYRAEHKMVASCMFPNSYPYVDNWNFADYSLFFISCLYDYFINTNDIATARELYPLALEQAELISAKLNSEKGFIDFNSHIDWCPGLDKSVSLLGVYIYTLKQLSELSEALGENSLWITDKIKIGESFIKKFYSQEKGLFIAESGQISWHSQIWGILSGMLDDNENLRVLESVKKCDTSFTMRTPYMIHYYIEALYKCSLKEEAMGVIRDYWGKIIDSGFDCCPEVFNVKNEFESPYKAPEINSACHAWSCTPAYWIYKYYNEN